MKRGLPSSERSVSPPAVKRKHDANHVSEICRGQQPPYHVGSRVANHTSIKIVSWNANGVGPLLQQRLSFGSAEKRAIYPLRSLLKRHDWPQLLCLQEVKIKNGDDATQCRLKRAANEGCLPDEPLYDIVFSLPTDKYNAIGFGGKIHGVASLIRSDFSETTITRKPEWDLEGRFLVHETPCGLVIINGYWINGTTAPYRNPKTGLPDGVRHDLKLRYHRHVLDEVLRYQETAYQVVLVGDMNVARDSIDGYPNLRTNPIQHVKNRADFNDKFFEDKNGMRGIDVFRHFHRNERKYTYHSASRPWGTSMDRVDLIIASRSLMEEPRAITACDICDTKEDAGHSDHVPLWVMLDALKLAKAQQSPHG